ncbi:MAG TPA: hypothetical protein VEH07_06735, partial [Alphaproteobacteria bacterium]|nr:hypothetical protein [Alphaproteobacteria bacterium]
EALHLVVAFDDLDAQRGNLGGGRIPPACKIAMARRSCSIKSARACQLGVTFYPVAYNTFV